MTRAVKLISDNAEIQRQAEPQAGCFEIVTTAKPEARSSYVNTFS
jgi:hypothetical protein